MFLQFFIFSFLSRVSSILYFRILREVFKKCIVEEVILYETVEVFSNGLDLLILEAAFSNC